MRPESKTTSFNTIADHSYHNKYAYEPKHSHVHRRKQALGHIVKRVLNEDDSWGHDRSFHDDENGRSGVFVSNDILRIRSDFSIHTSWAWAKPCLRKMHAGPMMLCSIVQFWTSAFRGCLNSEITSFSSSDTSGGRGPDDIDPAPLVNPLLSGILLWWDQISVKTNYKVIRTCSGYVFKQTSEYEVY